MEEERRGTRLLGWLFVRLGIWGLGAVVGYIIASSLLPRPSPEIHGLTAIGPARVSWGFVATFFGCLALGLLLWRDNNWGNKVALALAFAVMLGTVTSGEAQTIAMILGFGLPVVYWIIRSFFGREAAPARPIAQPQATQPGAGIGFQAGIGLGGVEQIDLARILADRERATADSAATQLLGWCDQAFQRGGRIGALAGVLAEQILTEQLARRGIRLVEPEEEAAEEQPQPRISRIRNLLSGGKWTIPKV